jgi:hypothetical protein
LLRVVAAELAEALEDLERPPPRPARPALLRRQADRPERSGS